jgi:hypothetical protein
MEDCGVIEKRIQFCIIKPETKEVEVVPETDS